MRSQPHQEQIGFLTFAINTSEINYLELAYLQAINIKCTQPNSKYAVIVDTDTERDINDSHRNVFDYIINCDIGDSNLGENNKGFSNEWKAFWLTPFKETIKLESDLLLTRDISHWLHAFRLNDVVLSYSCKNYHQQISNVRKYRRVFDDNQLPDVYNGLMYFRFSQDAQKFFTVARYIFENWDIVKAQLKNCRDDNPTTDLVYALSARIVGEDRCCIPSLDFINFVHMKPGIQLWSDDKPWYEQTNWEIDGDILRIGNTNQLSPVHYYNKDFAKHLLEYYESRIARTN
jgi:hypothetical protein